MLNLVAIEGRLTSDPEVKVLSTGNKVANFTLANNRKINDKEYVVFVEVEVWGNSADWVAQWFKKGKPAQVTGRLNMQSWEVDGQKRSKLSITADKVDFVDFGAPKPEVEETVKQTKRKNKNEEDNIPF